MTRVSCALQAEGLMHGQVSQAGVCVAEQHFMCARLCCSNSVYLVNQNPALASALPPVALQALLSPFRRGSAP